jgi:hypothetical protein
LTPEFRPWVVPFKVTGDTVLSSDMHRHLGGRGRSALHGKSLLGADQSIGFSRKTDGRKGEIAENRCPVAKVRLARKTLSIRIGRSDAGGVFDLSNS